MAVAPDSKLLRGSPVVRRLTTVAIARPGLTALVWLCLAIASLPGLMQLEFATTAGSMLNRTGSAWSFYRESLQRFGGDEVVVVALEADEPFDPELLRSVAAISERVEGLSGVRRVDSLSTLPIVRSLPDGTLHLDPALDWNSDFTRADAERARRIVGRDRIAPRTLVSDDGRVLAVNVILEDSEDLDRVAVMDGIDEALGERQGWVSGVPVFETRVGPRTQVEVTRFVPITTALMALIMAVLFRSFYAVLVPLLCGSAGTVLLLALMGVNGEPLTILGILLPSILIALACAYVMHILAAVSVTQSRAERVRAIHDVATPVALSGLTTMLGFFALSIVEIDAIRSLGAYGGLGVAFVLAASLTLAPALVELRPAAIRRSELDELIRRRFAGALVSFAARRRVPILVAWVGGSLLAGVGLSAVEVETDGTRWWPRGSEVREDYEAIRERLSGISPVNVVLEATGSRAVTDPEVTGRIAELSSHLEDLPAVGKAVSLADPLRQMHAGFLGDAYAALPRDQQLIAQYLLLLESVDHIKDLVAMDHRSANVLLRVDDNGSAALLAVAREAERWWAENGLEDFAARATGIMFEFARSEDAITRGQLQGLSMAVAAVAVILFALFRRPSIVVIALLPNILPLAVMFGGMGLFGMPLDAGTACLGSMALGIAVDDTIHVMVGFRGQHEVDQGVRAALVDTYRNVLPPLIYTTLIVALGFGVLAFSEFTLTRNLGWVTSSLVVLCLLADVTLLPALLLRGQARDARSE